tara:strand:+ start:178 stop:969 length:792 start_codon:yes stop_codon:yes gene_type:complete
MSYKYYPSLQLSSGVQTPPLPMFLHNDNSAAITLNITPFPGNNVFSALDPGDSVLDGFNVIPELSAIQGATTYVAKTLTGDGSGAEITVTVSQIGVTYVPTTAVVATSKGGANYLGGDVIGITLHDESITGVGAGLTASIGTPLQAALFTYTPSTDGSGTGSTITFSIDASGGFKNVVYTTLGTGYAAGDVLTFSENGQTIGWLLTAADIGAFYPVRITIPSAVIDTPTIPLRLNSGATTPMRINSFSVAGTSNKSVLAMATI